MAYSNVFVEIDAVVNAKPVKCDFGVRGSPEWVEYEDKQLESLNMFGKEWTEKELRVVFGDMGTDALLGLIFDECEEWDDE